MEEEVKSLRKKLKIYTAVIAFLTVIALVFLMFAFVQRAEAKRQQELAKQLMIEVLKQKEIAEQERQIVEKNKIMAEELTKRMEEASREKK